MIQEVINEQCSFRILLGASFNLVIILATSTWHYRSKMIEVARKREEALGNNSVGSLQEEPVFYGRHLDSSDSTGSQHSCRDFQDQPISMPRTSQNYKSCENLLQGMPSTQHVEIGGEAFYQPFIQHRGQGDNQYS